MWSRRAQMGQQPLVVAPGVQQRICKNSKAGGVQRAGGQLALLVDTLGDPAHRAVVPSQDGHGEWRGGAARVAEDVTEGRTQCSVFGNTIIPTAGFMEYHQ